MALRPGLTVPDLARATGCTRAVVHNYLAGKNKTVEAHLLFALADQLDISARWLLTGHGHMARERALEPDQLRVLQTYSQLGSEGARDLWIAQGEEILRRQPELMATRADPFNGHRPPETIQQEAAEYTRAKHE